MKPVTDEELAAFLDGAMNEADASALEARFSTDPELAARAERWLANDRRIRAALIPLADAPVGADLLARMGLTVNPAPIAANDNPPWWRRNALPLGGALAASLAAVLLLVPRQAEKAGADLSFALETAASLQSVKLADGSTVTPTLTLRAADGRWCREYRVAALVGLACRDDERWRIEAEGKGSGPANSGEIGVAAGADTAALDAAYSRLGTADPLDGAAEAALIARGWE